MLRIKENINLAILKDYGFHQNGLCWEKRIEHGQPSNAEGSEAYILVGSYPNDENGRNIGFYYCNFDYCEEEGCLDLDELFFDDTLYDLINDGLTEKV